MYVYQEKKRYFAQIADGMEDMCASELERLGAQSVKPVFRGIYFNADAASLYRINFTSRLISRVLAPLKTFKCFTPEELYGKSKGINWEDFFAEERTFAVFANIANSKLKHSKYAALLVKDAIVDILNKKQNRRPKVDTTDPDIRISLFIENNIATISFDTSGGALHRRGYRVKPVEAGMQEILAAVIIELSEWDGKIPICDPMCGSGTLLCEAVMRCCQIPAGLLRKRFGFEYLPDFDGRIWKMVKEKESDSIKKLEPGKVFGSDISRSAVAAATANLDHLPEGKKVKVKQCDFRRLEGLENTVIVCNPPYGRRLKKEKDLGLFYKDFGDFLKQKCKGSTAYIYFGNREMIKKIGLKTSWKKPFKNGGLDGRLVRFDLY